ncbi:MAG TPA: MOSC domain-containing protein [Candidatus Binataceae bacterium]|nr:MOSC domain-containing protein [Candidatus Binataceae bacterium]
MSKASLGSVLTIWRYPIKSMQGEEVSSSRFNERGLLGDRAYALIEHSTGKIASAKNPRKWFRLFTFSARMAEEPEEQAELPRVVITFPNGTQVYSDQPDIDAILSGALERDITLCTQVPDIPQLEKFWPDIDSAAKQEPVTEEEIPTGTFFDGEVVHLLTTASLETLNSAFPGSIFDARRFRPNLVIATPPEQLGFVENSWIGNTIAIGDEVRLKIIRPTKRCVITTLPLDDLPRDLGILRAAVQANQAAVGVYASVARGGFIHKGDQVSPV